MNVINIATQLTQTFGYLGICLLCMIPFPSEVVLPFIGLGISNGNFNFFLALLCTILTEIVVSIVNYIIGYYGGNDALAKIENKIPNSKNGVEKIGKILRKYREFAIIIARIVPFLRTYISLLAGVEKLNKYIFTILSAIGITIVNIFLLALGYYIGNNKSLIGSILKKYSIVTIMIIVITIIVFIVYDKMKKSKK